MLTGPTQQLPTPKGQQLFMPENHVIKTKPLPAAAVAMADSASNTIARRKL
jgi:hypothetical protein